MANDLQHPSHIQKKKGGGAGNVWKKVIKKRDGSTNETVGECFPGYLKWLNVLFNIHQSDQGCEIKGKSGKGCCISNLISSARGIINFDFIISRKRTECESRLKVYPMNDFSMNRLFS